LAKDSYKSLIRQSHIIHLKAPLPLPPLHCPPPLPPASVTLPPDFPFAVMMGDHQHDKDMMGNQPQQDEEEASTPATMRQSKIVKEIMGKVVAEKSSINYARQNSTFALFVYEKNEELRGHLLESWFVELQHSQPSTKKKEICARMSPGMQPGGQ
jgi:hypothetical protein